MWVEALTVVHIVNKAAPFEHYMVLEAAYSERDMEGNTNNVKCTVLRPADKLEVEQRSNYT